MENKNNYQTKIASYGFMITGGICLIFSILIDANVTGFWLFIKNILNALGSIFIVGGVFEIAYKKKFADELSTDFTTKLFLDKDAIQNFEKDNLRKMVQNIQLALSKGKHNEYQNKIMKLMNNHFLCMLDGTHQNEEFNSYYDYYDINIHIEESKEEFITVNYNLKYKIINHNPKNKIKQSILAKRFFPQVSQENMIYQELESLKVISDYKKEISYLEEIEQNKFKEVDVKYDRVHDAISAKKNKEIKKQIQLINSDSTEELIVEFSKFLIIEKSIKIKTLYTDEIFSHIFRKPVLNFMFSYIDNNIDTSLDNPIELRLFSGLNKIKNDKLHPVQQGKKVSLSVHNELLLPGEGITTISKRKLVKKEN